MKWDSNQRNDHDIALVKTYNYIPYKNLLRIADLPFGGSGLNIEDQWFEVSSYGAIDENQKGLLRHTSVVGISNYEVS